MNIREYYAHHFRNDLASMFRGMDARDVRYTFGNDWVRECSLLPRVPETRRASLLICLYFTVLVDQAMHTYFIEAQQRFEKLTMYPKFLVGFGHEAHLNPVLLFQIPIQRGLVAEALIRELIPSGLPLFVEETKQFFRQHMPDIDTGCFFGRLIADSDVVPPDVLSHDGPESLPHFVGRELKKALAARAN